MYILKNNLLEKFLENINSIIVIEKMQFKRLLTDITYFMKLVTISYNTNTFEIHMIYLMCIFLYLYYCNI